VRARLYRTDAALTTPVRAGAQTHATRVCLFLELEHDGVGGVGEVAPQPVEVNGDPGVEAVAGSVVELVARVRAALEREGALPAWSRVGQYLDGRAASRAGAALVEMALLDRTLRVEGRTLADQWPPRYDVRTTATVSLLDDAPWTVDAAVARVRVKCAPGELTPGALARLARLSVPVLVDYNATADDDEAVLTQIRAIGERAPVVAVEQPYAPGNLADSARLAGRLAALGVATSLDEGVRTVGDVAALTRYGAASMVCVKPARVGGLAQSRRVVAAARERGLAVYLGGFFESPYARTVHRAFVAHCVDEPSDVGVVEVEGPRETVASDGGVGLRPNPSLLGASPAREL
jgi:o-succinylbenzoate synthase